MSKEELIEVFKDTEEFYTYNEDSLVTTSVECCQQLTAIYDSDIVVDIQNPIYKEPALVKVTNRDTLTAAEEYVKLTEINEANNDGDEFEGFVAILNFASATNPGGGVTKGSSAQEECLCRCSTLYPALNQKKCWDKYYNINRAANSNLGSDTIIYTQDVLVFKDKDYKYLNDKFCVDVITCAAPNLRDKPNNSYNNGASKNQLTLTDEELYNIHVNRAKRIFEVANKNCVDYLVLGAFGCGAFKNNPEIVAKAYKDVIPLYARNFKVIDFAIIDGKYSNNYEVFKRVLLQ